MCHCNSKMWHYKEMQIHSAFLGNANPRGITAGLWVLIHLVPASLLIHLQQGCCEAETSHFSGLRTAVSLKKHVGLGGFILFCSSTPGRGWEQQGARCRGSGRMASFCPSPLLGRSSGDVVQYNSNCMLPPCVRESCIRSAKNNLLLLSLSQGGN